jgi:hypothetical protein
VTQCLIIEISTATKAISKKNTALTKELVKDVQKKVALEPFAGSL